MSVVTFHPGTPAPTVNCPACDTVLVYQETTYGGVKPAERWDRFTCPACRLNFEYRHRTRTMKPVL
jgi:transposase-like protein